MNPRVEYGDTRLPDSFWDRVHPEPNTGCWLWSGGTDQHGYGRCRISGVLKRCHQWTYGPVPVGLVLDHYVCQTPACCNPDHLEPVTQAENARRGRSYWRSLTSCMRGHEFTEENTRQRRDGGRDCIECDRIRGSKYRRTESARLKARIRQANYMSRKRAA